MRFSNVSYGRGLVSNLLMATLHAPNAAGEEWKHLCWISPDTSLVHDTCKEVFSQNNKKKKQKICTYSRLERSAVRHGAGTVPQKITDGETKTMRTSTFGRVQRIGRLRFRMNDRGKRLDDNGQRHASPFSSVYND